MSIYSSSETGTKLYRTRFNLSYRKLFDCNFGFLIPAMAKFVLPGDVWKCGANMLIRYQPMLAPPLTRAYARMRYFFVPLRLVEPNTEKIITGSDNGKLITTSLPNFEGFMDRVNQDSNYNVEKYSFYDYLGVPCINYKNIKNDVSMPAAYWYKAYLRCYYDYYLDENLRPSTMDNFDSIVQNFLALGGSIGTLRGVFLKKDYFTSSLPFQLKGVAPTISISGGNVDFSSAVTSSPTSTENVYVSTESNQLYASSDAALISALNKNSIVSAGSINMDDLRTMAAQTRVFERLARTGSRYTEMLKANFGTAPADGTLQRAQYLGGFKQPIVTTEVVQTGQSENNPVGTLRGHGISNGGNTIKPFIAKEFGVILGLLDIVPELQYTQGINRELTYKSRFDFFNPSFQHLSEQEVRNGEIFVSSSDGKNDDTFGFQAIYNELRSSRDMVVGDLRDTLSYWTQSIRFGTRPNLNYDFISASSYKSNFMQPFAVTSKPPIIVDCGNLLDVYRPMVKYATPGLVDHL